MPALILRFFDDGEKRLVVPNPEQPKLFSAITSPLQVTIEEMRFCSKCLREERFVADRDCSFGLVGTCQGCGDEYLRPFSRTTSEVA